MEAGTGRGLYIDESGDSDTSLVLAALSFDSGLDVDAEAATQEVISNLASVLPGLDASKEIHAHKLARELRQKEIRERQNEVLLRNHERDFVYQHLLHHLAGWTSARLHLVMWNWGGPGHGKDSRKGERQRILMARLLEWVAEENETIDRIWIDASSQHRHYVRGSLKSPKRQGCFFESRSRSIRRSRA